MMSINCGDQEVRVIGIDCATIPQRTGISLGFFSNGDIAVQEAFRCSDSTKPEEKVVEWITSSTEHQKTLIAIDAPLGWPVPLTTGLVNHAAGTFIQGNADDLFYRRTEQMILERFGFRPLAVGSDLIARTAHAALALIESIRSKVDAEIPLVWANNSLPSISLIEVYPAATLKSHDIQCDGSYKKQIEARRQVVNKLKSEVGVS